MQKGDFIVFRGDFIHNWPAKTSKLETNGIVSFFKEWLLAHDRPVKKEENALIFVKHFGSLAFAVAS